ncbi:MAG: SDR family NAD(P)-dependent oxidoreductase [Spirochaetes bacterium]|nr:SDR family NAD(P)-dependent oxidoreductase [Spirochaetota bacterium]
MKPDPRFSGKVFFITGASSGIGWATAVELAASGARLALCARRKGLLDSLARQLGDRCETLVLPFDVANLAMGKRAVDRVVKKWGRIDYLINNAGIIRNAHFHDQGAAETEYLTRVNYLGPAALIQATLPHMLRAGRGHVVNVSSIGGVLGFPFVSSYCASKFALVGLTEALRKEYYGTGITFSAFCPGNVDTPMIAESMKNPRFRKVARPMTAQKAARLILRCCRWRTPELIRGEVPPILAKLSKFFPGWVDFAFHQIYRRVHPIARKSVKERSKP